MAPQTTLRTSPLSIRHFPPSPHQIAAPAGVVVAPQVTAVDHALALAARRFPFTRRLPQISCFPQPVESGYDPVAGTVR